MNFQSFAKQIQDNVARMTANPARLFFVNVERDRVFETYLDAFDPEDNPVFAERATHDCQACRHFIRDIGHMVSVNSDLTVTTVWDGVTGEYRYVAEAVAAFVRGRAADGRAFAAPALFAQRKIGIPSNAGVDKRTGAPALFRHLNAELPAALVHVEIAPATAEVRESAEMLKRALATIPDEAVESVLELIAQNSLYRGDQWKSQLEALLSFKRAHASVSPEKREALIWVTARSNKAVARIRNTSVGTLLVDIAEGKELEEAVTAYERITAPENYRRPTEVVTKATLAKARLKVEELGLLESLPHRFACIDDISVRDVIFVDRSVAPAMIGGDPFAALGKQVSEAPKSFDRVPAITMDKFLSDVVPVSARIEAVVTPEMRNRFVSLLAPVNANAPALTRWSNNFTWAYAGNLADSSMKALVQKHGGRVDGDLRFSISWNADGQNRNDMDAHAEGGGEHIAYYSKTGFRSDGELDVDVMHPTAEEAVENITWPSRGRMRPGRYNLYVETYDERGGRGPLRAEVEFDGVIHKFEYPGGRSYCKRIPIAAVTLADGVFTLAPGPYAADTATAAGAATWGVTENAFTRVLAILPSPSHWHGEAAAGARHTFFMLEGCVSPEQPNSFFNEFLPAALTPHRKVLEALGRSLKVEPDPKQLSGVGFIASRPADLIVRSHGATVRTLKITQ